MENTDFLRISFFILALLLLVVIENLLPKRKMQIPKKVRWFRNFSLIIIDSILLKIFLPFTLVSISVYAQNNGIGLFNYFKIDTSITAILSFIALDLIIYFQHVLFHRIPILWRVHKIHHIDQEIDTSTGLRFHPIEILFSYLLKTIAILAIGTPAIAVIIFEIVLNIMAMFTHSNTRLNEKLDKALRKIFVTPDIHRIHHSTDENETNSNFGFNFSFWDKIFKTYKPQPHKGHHKMSIGLKEYPDHKKTGLKEIIILPFSK